MAVQVDGNRVAGKLGGFGHERSVVQDGTK
jgi:hypothetical protein